MSGLRLYLYLHDDRGACASSAYAAFDGCNLISTVARHDGRTDLAIIDVDDACPVASVEAALELDDNVESYCWVNRQ